MDLLIVKYKVEISKYVVGISKYTTNKSLVTYEQIGNSAPENIFHNIC